VAALWTILDLAAIRYLRTQLDKAEARYASADIERHRLRAALCSMQEHAESARIRALASPGRTGTWLDDGQGFRAPDGRE
jgi:hypothetical protein